MGCTENKLSIVFRMNLNRHMAKNQAVPTLVYIVGGAAKHNIGREEKANSKMC